MSSDDDSLPDDGEDLWREVASVQGDSDDNSGHVSDGFTDIPEGPPSPFPETPETPSKENMSFPVEISMDEGEPPEVSPTQLLRPRYKRGLLKSILLVVAFITSLAAYVSWECWTRGYGLQSLGGGEIPSVAGDSPQDPHLLLDLLDLDPEDHLTQLIQIAHTDHLLRKQAVDSDSTAQQEHGAEHKTLQQRQAEHPKSTSEDTSSPVSEPSADPEQCSLQEQPTVTINTTVSQAVDHDLDPGTVAATHGTHSVFPVNLNGLASLLLVMAALLALVISSSSSHCHDSAESQEGRQAARVDSTQTPTATGQDEQVQTDLGSERDLQGKTAAVEEEEAHEPPGTPMQEHPVCPGTPLSTCSAWESPRRYQLRSASKLRSKR